MFPFVHIQKKSVQIDFVSALKSMLKQGKNIVFFSGSLHLSLSLRLSLVEEWFHHAYSGALADYA